MATLKRNKDGKFKVEEESAATGAPAMSFFEDDEGENLYSGTVLLDGQPVRVRELTASEVAAYTSGQREIARLMVEVTKASDGDAAEAQAQEIKQRQIELYDAVIERGVTAWELKRPDGEEVPCTPESKKKLRVSKKAELSDKIVQRSTIGRDMSAFLGG